MRIGRDGVKFRPITIIIESEDELTLLLRAVENHENIIGVATDPSEACCLCAIEQFLRNELSKQGKG